MSMKKKLGKSDGFSLAETLVAVTILLMVATLMTSGITLSTFVHKKVVDKANAQVLLSTTLTELRTRLTNVKEVSVTDDEASITFMDNETGYYETITSGTTADGKTGIFITDGTTTSMLVSYETSSKGMLVSCSFSYDKENGLISVKNITVTKDAKDDTILAHLDNYLIRNW